MDGKNVSFLNCGKVSFTRLSLALRKEKDSQSSLWHLLFSPQNSIIPQGHTLGYTVLPSQCWQCRSEDGDKLGRLASTLIREQHLFTLVKEYFPAPDTETIESTTGGQSLVFAF